MEWHALLSARRLGQSHREPPPPELARSEYAKDFDRIVFSSAFRRLQDKTQVFPLSRNDYVRTRLTHSMEVSCVGRSLGTLAGREILQRDPALRTLLSEDHMGTIVAAACLAHDIGNPPYGHMGEYAIQEWFSASPTARALVQRWGLSPAEQTDLEHFEGNAQGFRTLAYLQSPHNPGGMQLTAAVLGTFTKYPRGSVVGEHGARGISGKKFGFFQAELPQFQELAELLGLRSKPGESQAWVRHPLSFLVEAADDICYHLVDVEDAMRAGTLSYDEVYALYEPFIDSGIQRRLDDMHIQDRRIEYLRARVMNRLVLSVAQRFCEVQGELLAGEYERELISDIPEAEDLSRFKQLAAARVYQARPVMEICASGFPIIEHLLQAFLPALDDVSTRGADASIRSRLLVPLMPSRYTQDGASLSGYACALRVTDFVSGMTDSYALNTYQRLHGLQVG